ncbi:MAG: hypothetical protein Aurels2KO_45480 [Aureliella sp.]
MCQRPGEAASKPKHRFLIAMNHGELEQLVAKWLGNSEFMNSKKFASAAIEDWAMPRFGDDGKRRLMHWAIVMKCTPLAKRLIQLDLAMGVDECGESPLYYALIEGNEEVAMLCLDSGAPVESVFCIGELPIHIAIKQRLDAVLQRLLELGVDVDGRMTDERLISPLDLAIRCGKEYATSLLRRHGGRVCSRAHRP